MSGKEQREPERNKIEKIVRKSFGYDDDSLLAEFEAAEHEAKELHNKGSLRAESGLEELKERIHQLDIHPIYQADYEKENMSEDLVKKPIRLKWTKRVVFFAATMGVLALAGVLVSFGKRSLKYWDREVGVNQSKVVWNNVDAAVGGLALEQAYQEIENELGIHVIQLGYFPEGMEYQSISLGKGYAVLEFSYQGKMITFIQTKPSVEHSWSLIADRIVYDTFENEWLNSEVVLSKNQLENNEIEYQGDLVLKDAIYSLQGIMDETVFREMLESLTY